MIEGVQQTMASLLLCLLLLSTAATNCKRPSIFLKACIPELTRSAHPNIENAKHKWMQTTVKRNAQFFCTVISIWISTKISSSDACNEGWATSKGAQQINQLPAIKVFRFNFASVYCVWLWPHFSRFCKRISFSFISTNRKMQFYVNWKSCQLSVSMDDGRKTMKLSNATHSIVSCHCSFLLMVLTASLHFVKRTFDIYHKKCQVQICSFPYDTWTSEISQGYMLW